MARCPQPFQVVNVGLVRRVADPVPKRHQPGMNDQECYFRKPIRLLAAQESFGRINRVVGAVDPTRGEKNEVQIGVS